jgi:hypothetical protein
MKEVFNGSTDMLQLDNPLGHIIRVRKIRSRGVPSPYFAVSVDGRWVDSYLTFERAERKAQALYHSTGGFL